MESPRKAAEREAPLPPPKHVTTGLEYPGKGYVLEQLKQLVEAARHLGLELVVSVDRDNLGLYLFNVLDPKRGAVVMYGAAPSLKVVAMYCEHYLQDRLSGGRGGAE